MGHNNPVLFLQRPACCGLERVPPCLSNVFTYSTPVTPSLVHRAILLYLVKTNSSLRCFCIITVCFLLYIGGHIKSLYCILQYKIVSQKHCNFRSLSTVLPVIQSSSSVASPLIGGQQQVRHVKQPALMAPFPKKLVSARPRGSLSEPRPAVQARCHVSMYSPCSHLAHTFTRSDLE